VGYYELQPKQNKVIRHFVRENDGFVCLQSSNWEREVAVLQLTCTPRKLSTLFCLQFNNDQGNTPPPFSQFILCCLQYSTVELELHSYLVTFDNVTYTEFLSVTKTCLIVTRRSFPPSPVHRERLACGTLLPSDLMYKACFQSVG